MSARAKARQVVAEAEAITRGTAGHVRTHLHGNEVACPCGVEGGGLVTVAVTGDYEAPERCGDCGKPASAWGDLRAVRCVERHRPGCPAGPASDLCAACGKPLGSGVLVLGDGGFVHFHCHPDVQSTNVL